MSAKMSGMVWDRYPDNCPHGELLVALALADHAHDDGTHIYPAVDSLARKARQSRRAVQYALRRMEDARWLLLVAFERGGRRNGGINGRPREYRINPLWIKGADFASLALPAEGEIKGAESAPTGDDAKGCKSEQIRAQTGTDKGADDLHPNHQLTVNEPPVNPHSPPSGGGAPAEPVKVEVQEVEPFELFWKAYPNFGHRKVAKAKCQDKWKARKLDASAGEIIAHVQAMSQTDQWKRGFEPAPLTYINQSRWQDPIPTAQDAAQGQSGKFDPVAYALRRNRGGRDAADIIDV